MYESLYLQNVQGAMDEAIEIIQNKLNLQARIRSKKVHEENQNKGAILSCVKKHSLEFNFQKR